MMKRILCGAGFGLMFLATASAFAAEGYVTGNVNLRAGPDSSYPAVVRLRAGTTVDIDGCVDGWSWCDVSTGDDRGWIAGDYLQEEYEGRRVRVPSYGVQIGIPILSFVFADYWGEHYRHRSWYGNRDRWSHVRPQYRSAYIRQDAHTNSYNHSTYDSHAGSGLHESRSPTYRGPDTSRQTYRVPQQRATVQTEATRERPALQRDNAHVQRVESNAGTAHRAAGGPVVQSGASPAMASHSGEHRVEQSRVVAEHKVTPTNASSRGMEMKSAHEPARDKGRNNDKADVNGDGKGNGKDKNNGNGKGEGQH